MGFEGKPSFIKEAAFDGNKQALSNMGKKGAQEAHKKRADRKEIEEIQIQRLQEKREEEDEEIIKSANEHIISPDGEDLDYMNKG